MFKDTKTTIPSEAMSLDIGTLLKLIPHFDTEKNEQVYRFVRSCDSAFKLGSTEQAQILLVYALNNITGSGASDIHAKQISSWSELRSFLIDKFSNVKTISHLNLELQSMFQKPTESITDYFHRVDLSRSKIVEKLNAEICDSSLPGRLATTEETALSVFVNGLNSNMGCMLRTKGFSNLSEAGRFALQEDKIRAMNDARQSLFKSAFSRPAAVVQKPQNRIFQPRLTYNNNAPTNSKICNYCKNPGHVISECRKRMYNNQKYGQPHQSIQRQHQNPPMRALPAPVNHLNSEAAIQIGNSMETASDVCQSNLANPELLNQFEHLNLN